VVIFESIIIVVQVTDMATIIPIEEVKVIATGSMGWRIERLKYEFRLVGPTGSVELSYMELNDVGIDKLGRWAYACRDNVYSVFDLHAKDVLASRQYAKVLDDTNRFVAVMGDGRLKTVRDDGLPQFSLLMEYC